jgi:hypothetical protein
MQVNWFGTMTEHTNWIKIGPGALSLRMHKRIAIHIYIYIYTSEVDVSKILLSGIVNE